MYPQDLNLIQFTKQLANFSSIKTNESHQHKEKREQKYNEYARFKSHFAYFPLFFMFPTMMAKEKDEGEESDLFTIDNSDQLTKKLSRRSQFNFIADVVELVLPSIVQIEQKQHTLFGIAAVANGSGFIVDEDGIILTNAHVVRDISADLVVKLNDGRTYKGRVVKIDKSADLAIIKIDCVGLFYFQVHLSILKILIG